MDYVTFGGQATETIVHLMLLGFSIGAVWHVMWATLGQLLKGIRQVFSRENEL